MNIRITEIEEINNISVACDAVEVTIWCNTYNHEEYLADALESFVRQKTGFEYEIVIYDDASTDGTTEIIRNYSKMYPELIRAFVGKTNIYNNPQRGAFFREWTKNNFRGKYIAFCEGDDYWIDDQKIQKQWEMLEQNPECDMCACCGSVVIGDQEAGEIRPHIGDGILTTEEVILGGGMYLATAGLFYRTGMRNQQMNFEKILPLDYTTQIRGSLRGGIYYIDRKMVVYRRFSKGGWSSTVLKNKELLSEQWKKEKEMLIALDKETDGTYTSTIKQRLRSYEPFLQQLYEHEESICKTLAKLDGRVFLWGLGRRGSDFEEFCYEHGISLSGVCDISNEHIGEKTNKGNIIFSTDEVLRAADCILASNSDIFERISGSSFDGNVVDLQEYMPFG